MDGIESENKIEMMKLTNILLLEPLVATGAKAHQDDPGPGENSMNVTNATASPGRVGGYSLVTRDEAVWWDDTDDDQEKCAYADATNTIGARVILKRDCRKLANYFGGRSGFWTLSGYNWGDDVWATLAYRGTCSFAVARVDGQEAAFE